MKEKVNLFFQRTTTEVLHPNAIFLYRKIVYSFVFIFTLLQLPVAKHLFGKESLLPPTFYTGNVFLQALNILSHSEYTNYYPLFIGVLLSACVLSFFVKKQTILSILIYFCVANLYHRTISIQNGGGDLLMLQLFFLMLMNENSGKMKEGNLKIIFTSLTNFAFIASQVQVIMVYVVSSIYKLQGSQWLDGSALYYVLVSGDYSLHFIQKWITQNNLLLQFATWITLIFQLIFPIAIWSKKLKPFLFAIGITIHLMIAFVMGILDFGILMIMMYILFIEETQCFRTSKFLGILKQAS